VSKNYKEIPIWENKKRIKELIKFRRNVVTYFNNLEAYNIMGIKEKKEAQEIRIKINKKIDKIHSYFDDAGSVTSMHYIPPPAIGGYEREIDLLVNIFNLYRYPEISPKYIVDYIDRVLGIYENDIVSAIFRTINPLYWFFKLIEFIASFPFRFLESIGLNRERIESSLSGRIIKGIFELIIVIAALLTILEVLGCLETTISFFRKVLNI